MMSAILAVLLAVSAAANAYQFFKTKTQKRKETYDAQDLMRDLLAGSSLIKVTRVAPQDVFIRSPRDQE